METTTATEKEVLRSLLSMERGDVNNANRPPPQQHQQMQHHRYAQPGEEPHNLSTSQQQQQGHMAIAENSVTIQPHHPHQQQQQQQQQHPGHHAVEHQQQQQQQQHQQQHGMQTQPGIYKAGGSQHDQSVHSHVQWMAQTPTSGHQVIILHAPPEQQPGDGSGGAMSGLIQAAEQGQLVGQQVWETHVTAEYPAGSVQLSDGTILPAHPEYGAPPHGLHPQPAGHEPSYVLVDAKDAIAAPAAGATAGKRQAKQTAKKKKKRRIADMLAEGIDPSKLEDNAEEVRTRFQRGCDCAEENCFRTLNAEFVYRHRLNIAELSKHEHDMYLMGVTMACLSNPEETARHKERKRLRAKYVFQGKEVCLEAFLYLENCTHYQLKRIRKHVITHGVTPRVHGNHGKRPHNTFPLDIYKHASDFLNDYLDKLSHKPEGKKTTKAVQSRRQCIHMPQDITRKKIHEKYVDFINHFEPEAKVMSYSAFRYFLKEQFSHVRFPKLDKTPVVEPGGVKQEAAISLPLQTPQEMTAAHQAVTHSVPPEGAEQSAPFSVQEHHPTATYTVSSRAYTTSGQLQYTGANYHYSIAM
ncbi:uncharacterized protein LOC122383230 [Amphibalanus amphitrite]|uniref:uncharacterized protein LOC122383230 n=1 Tax=Amphibalanus amphitrite TaxID=1232801 RepID=UPI001C921908|nr:uncharacterized protein LOC122383230 [Amphibalanus amphitrite]XP_043225388.1 uncharacterized protein LOC122383230 [Amphibalanus amphitrite]XP_043225399.1 uncharacterized protein LOC122383230 [Amphibalanus amphitrite]XP_043225405.1 uncharacterized protein LOC122383230 [Amphibalanus amphitrite]XP_043225412.1 uncharacterized protein LOC122383230 [Amphibalanus amphitrite]XP_043225419.1 uncharacterized protein LOC122383230 [Amphibalanus amphitrite]XP_043225429.1 uncharacterized protein LOC12238